MAKKFTELTTASQINETDITAISQETGGVWGSFKATISAIAQKIITGINFANAFNTNAKTVAGAVNEKLTSNAVADIEVSPAESAHSVGDHIIYNGIQYKVTSAIAIGDSLVINTNIEAETLDTRINNVDSKTAEKVSKTGDTMTGNLQIQRSQNTGHLLLGNNINSEGLITMYTNNQKYAQIKPPTSPTVNPTITLPNKDGTIALTSDLTNMAHIEKYTLAGSSISFHVPKGNALIFVARNIIGLYAKLTTNAIDTIVPNSNISSVTYDSTTEICTIVSNNQYTHEVIVVY